MTTKISSGIGGTLAGGILSALSMTCAVFNRETALKTAKEAKKNFQKRDKEIAERTSLSSRFLIAWGVVGVMEWVSYMPKSIFAQSQMIFSVFARSLSSILAALRFYGCVKDLQFYENLAETGKTKEVKLFAQRQFVATSFSALGELCFIGYFALQLGSVLLGAAFATGLTTLLPIVGILFLIAGCVYLCLSSLMSEIQKKINAT